MNYLIKWILTGCGLGVLYLFNRGLSTLLLVALASCLLLIPSYRTGRNKHFLDDESLASDWTSDCLQCLQQCKADSIDSETDLFIYRRLQDPKIIRLLQLLPAEPGDKLAGYVSHHLIKDAPPYLAISYCWGDPTGVNLIWINDKPLYIAKNAHDVLHRLRRRKQPRLLWIDCICIDQTAGGEIEKPQQLDIMGDIYKRAVQVAVYLGTAPDATHALWFVHCLYKTILNPYDPSIPPRTWDEWDSLLRLLHQDWFRRLWVVQEVTKASDIVFLYGPRSISWDILATVIDRIIVPLSVNFHGLTNDEVATLLLVFPYEMKGFRQIIRMRKSRGGLRRIFHALNLPESEIDGEEELEENDIKPTMSELLRRCGRLEASVPKDKIFALAGLSWETMRARNPITFFEIRPVASVILSSDYGMRTNAIYTKLAMKLLTFDQAPSREPLEILPSAGIGYPRSVTPLPSWVPDWSKFQESHSLSFDLGGANYRASGYSSTYNHFHTLVAETNHSRLSSDTMPMSVHGARDPRIRQYADVGPKPFTIILYGVRSDCIKEIFETPYEPEPKGKNADLMVQQLIAWYDSSLALAETLDGISFPGRVSMLDAYWRTLCGNRSFLNRTYQSPARPAYLQCYHDQLALYRRIETRSQEYRQRRAQGTRLPNTNPPSDKELAMKFITMQATPFAVSMRQHAGHRCFAITEGGRMALVPPLAKRGDLVCMILGAQTPFLLRSPSAGLDPVSGEGMTAKEWQDWFNGMYFFGGLKGLEIPGTIPEPSRVVMTRDNTFELVGECYVHGMMNGEMVPNRLALNEDLRKSSSVEGFVII